MGRVVSIVYTPRDTAERRPQGHYARVPADRVRLVEFQGIDGDTKGGSTQRQLNVMFAEVMDGLGADGFKTGPGELGEQVVVAGLDPAAVVEGVRVRLGEAVIEVGIPRTGCARFEMIQEKPRQDAKGRLGVLATVVAGGEVAVGDPAEMMPAEG